MPPWIQIAPQSEGWVVLYMSPLAGKVIQVALEYPKSREGAMKAAERWAEKLGGGKRLEIIISGER